jgi:hypothetical protein
MLTGEPTRVGLQAVALALASTRTSRFPSILSVAGAVARSCRAAACRDQSASCPTATVSRAIRLGRAEGMCRISCNILEHHSNDHRGSGIGPYGSHRARTAQPRSARIFSSGVRWWRASLFCKSFPFHYRKGGAMCSAHESCAPKVANVGWRIRFLSAFR